MQIESNRRIIKNTFMLYLRMMLSVCINLYASRVLLRQLGVDDFGVFNIVGGIVAMMGFLNTSMAGSSSRFFSYELGKGNSNILSATFASSMQAHLLVVSIVLILGETLGLWFVNTHLVIPDSRVIAANVVYQFALFSSLMTVLNVPYSAVIIAHERLDVYAFIEIINVVLKLAAVYLLTLLPFDKLIIYSILLFLVAVFLFLFYRSYCKRHFTGTVFSLSIDKSILLPMLKFSGWDFYGNGCVIIGQQGTNILLNRFWGVAVNAASGVATQASSAVSMFVSNITMSLRPPIIKLYASGDIRGMQNLLAKALVVCLVLAELLCVPMCLYIDRLMAIWLSDVPEYAAEFCKWMLISNSISVINPLLTSVIHATGNIKRLSIISGSLYLFNILFAYVSFRLFHNPVIAYMLMSVTSVSVIVSNLFIIKKQISEVSIMALLKKMAGPIICLIFAIGFIVALSGILPKSFWGFVLVLFINAFVTSLSLYVFWWMPNYGWRLKKLTEDDV